MDTVHLTSASGRPSVRAGRDSLLNRARPVATVHSEAFGSALNGSRNLLTFKALLAERVFAGEVGEKVGLVTSRSSAGRFAQGLGSIAVPGDMSDIRSPIRSTVYEAITPGGGRDRRGVGLIGIGARIGRGGGGALRCPVGFEFGGRYSTRGFGNCGRRLFEPAVGNAGGAARGVGAVGTIGASRRRVGAGDYEGRAVQIQRNAQIPRIGAANAGKFDEAIVRAVATFSDPQAGDLMLVRRDGQMLRSAVTANVLAGIANNPDMQDGALVARVTDPTQIGSDATPALWKSGIKKVSFALPGGGSISVRRTGTVTSNDKRRLGRVWARSTNQSDGEFDYGLRLRRLVDESNGKLAYEENFPNVERPDDTVTIADINDEKVTASVKRWVLGTYLSENAPGRDPKAKRQWKEIDVDSTSASVAATDLSTVEAAAKHLQNNGDPMEVPAGLLGEALRKAKAFRSTELRPGVTLLERGDGKRWYRVEADESFDHLAERVSADVNGALGLEMPPVKFIGEGVRRDFLVAHPENAGTRSSRQIVENMPPKDLLRVVVGDWLVDHRDRNPGSVLTIGRGDSARLVPTSNTAAAATGLSADELDARRRLTLQDFFGQSLNARAAERFEQLADAQKKILVDLYNELVERASNFNWDDYTSRLGLDGKMSSGEKAHLELIKKIYERRLTQLRSSRERFLKNMRIG